VESCHDVQMQRDADLRCRPARRCLCPSWRPGRKANPGDRGGNPTLVDLDLVSERGIDEGVIRLLNELLFSELTESGLYKVVDGSDIQAMLKTEQRKQLLGY